MNVDVGDFASRVEDGWGADTWALRGGFQAFVEMGAMDEEPALRLLGLSLAYALGVEHTCLHMAADSLSFTICTGSPHGLYSRSYTVS
jgi:hypothetical protein